MFPMPRSRRENESGMTHCRTRVVIQPRRRLLHNRIHVGRVRTLVEEHADPSQQLVLLRHGTSGDGAFAGGLVDVQFFDALRVEPFAAHRAVAGVHGAQAAVSEYHVFSYKQPPKYTITPHSTRPQNGEEREQEDGDTHS